MEKDFLDINLPKEEILSLLDLAGDIKKFPEKYSKKLEGKTLLMIFEKPSLRTRLSFEVGMTQLGGHAIYYDLSTSPMGKKESVSDTAKTSSRYCDIIMARLFSHQNLIELAKNSSVPVINALTDFSHPCQILSDLQTIREIKNKLEGLKLVYLGDGNNNITHSLLHACSILGINFSIASPSGKEYEPQQDVLKKAKNIAKSGSQIILTNNPEEAVYEADVVYTDSWMSYHIPKEKEQERIKILAPYRVTKEIMEKAKETAIFMHCLPAIRSMEVTAEVIDSNKSVVFQQAENRLYAQKALILKLLKTK